MAAAFPHLPRLGWDLIVTGEGEFTVLEVNAHAGNLTVQIHRPLLREPRVRRFYEHHGCL
jgi:D-alanine-D-alanine ligase-like ATP-grasp enzyme